MAGVKWTNEEIEVLKNKTLEGFTCKEISILLNRTERSTQHKFGELGLSKPSFKVGDKNNKLTILEIYTKYVYGQNKSYAKCICDCGKETHVVLTAINSGKTQSCGCLVGEKAKERISGSSNYFYKNGKGNLSNRLYRIWNALKSRCKSINSLSYKNYGGRGICVCDDWIINFENFEKWAIENGYNDTLSIDRKDVNGNYCPENCKWSNRKDQGNNKRNNIPLTIYNETKNISQWVADPRCVVSSHCLYYRINSGWEPELALTTPKYDKSIYKNRKYVYNPNRLFNRVRHGLADTRLYRIWSAMKRRCVNSNYPDYKNYGGRGISICDEWIKDFMSFYYWAQDNGYNDSLTLDRINNDGNYEPSNCKWSSYKEQSINRRNMKTLTIFGETKTVYEWLKDKRCNVKTDTTILNRIKKGMSNEEAITK